MEKQCSQCKQVKPLTEFHKKVGGNGYRSACKVCRNQSESRAQRYAQNPEKNRARKLAWAKAHPEYIQRKKLRDKELGYYKRYQVSRRSDYQAILTSQDGKCAICGADRDRVGDKSLALDHDHATGEIRGILCHSCNTGLGLFQDDPARLREAANYLEKYRETGEVLKIG